MLTNRVFDCDPEPQAPTEEEVAASDTAVADYVREGFRAGRDCRGALFDVKNLLEVNGFPITDTLVEATKK